MEELSSQQPEPQEVVLTYQTPEPQEVVERYTRPLPTPLLPPPELPPHLRQGKRGLRIFLGLCAALLGIIGAGWGIDRFLLPRLEWTYEVPPYYGNDWPDDRQDDAEAQAVTIPTYPFGQGAVLEVEAASGEPLPPQEIYRQLNPTVVTVMVQLSDGASVGTGVVFRQDGYVLTNYHVVEGGSSCAVTFSDNRTYEAKYVAGDAENDLAVLKVDLTGLQAAEFGDSDELTVGDSVYAIGNPLGVELRGTLTDGIVSAINRDVQVSGRTMTLIQTNAALNTGNSGGPLINVYGQVVGINTVKMTSRYSNIEGLGFAIPSSNIRVLVNDLLTYGAVQPEPALGVMVVRVGEQLADDVWGIQVQSVSDGSAAQLAGVEQDDYIVSADGVDIRSSQDLLRVLRQHHVGDPMTLTLWRDGRPLEVTVILQAAEDD